MSRCARACNDFRVRRNGKGLRRRALRKCVEGPRHRSCRTQPGTEGSNPSPSSRESVSGVTLSSWSRTPAFRAGFRATFPARSAESPRDANSAPTRGNVSVWPYSSTAFPAMRSRRAAVLKARDWSQTRSGFLGAQECRWILRDRTGIKQSRARSADRASRVANGSVRATFAPSDRAAGALRGSLG